MSPHATLRRALRMSANRHWFRRLVLAAWIEIIPLFAFLSPESVAAHALDLTGAVGHAMMLTLALLAAGALTDAAIHDLLPGRLQQFLMVNRHACTMAMALVLTMLGAALAHQTRTPLLLAPFVIPALLCVAVTALDLRAVHKGAYS